MTRILLFLVVLMALICGCDRENTRPNLNFEPNTFGCADFLVYRVNKRNNAVLSVSGSSHLLQLTKEKQAYNLADWPEEALEVRINRYNRNAAQFYCNDVIALPGERIGSWKAVRGKVYIQITEELLRADSTRYGLKLLMSMEEVLFENENGRQVEIPYEEFNEVAVGWLPG
jgi:hypothetical protein